MMMKCKMGEMMKTTKLRVKKLDERAIIPTYGSANAAGADLYAVLDENVTLLPGETKLIKTGLAYEIPEGYVGLLFARSGLSTKQGLAPATKVSVIDSDYRGELMVPLHNHSQVERTIASGDRIAQMVFTPYIMADFEVVDQLEDSVRGEGGFGSTGKK